MKIYFQGTNNKCREKRQGEKQNHHLALNVLCANSSNLTEQVTINFIISPQLKITIVYSVQFLCELICVHVQTCLLNS